MFHEESFFLSRKAPTTKSSDISRSSTPNAPRICASSSAPVIFRPVARPTTKSFRRAATSVSTWRPAVREDSRTLACLGRTNWTAHPSRSWTRSPRNSAFPYATWWTTWTHLRPPKRWPSCHDPRPRSRPSRLPLRSRKCCPRCSALPRRCRPSRARPCVRIRARAISSSQRSKRSPREWRLPCWREWDLCWMRWSCWRGPCRGGVSRIPNDPWSAWRCRFCFSAVRILSPCSAGGKSRAGKRWMGCGRRWRAAAIRTRRRVSCRWSLRISLFILPAFGKWTSEISFTKNRSEFSEKCIIWKFKLRIFRHGLYYYSNASTVQCKHETFFLSSLTSNDWSRHIIFDKKTEVLAYRMTVSYWQWKSLRGHQEMMSAKAGGGGKSRFHIGGRGVKPKVWNHSGRVADR